MAITTRAGKGSDLTYAELDTNFTDLRDGINTMLPGTEGTGIKVDSLGTATFAWEDLLGTLVIDDNNANCATYQVYRGNLRQLQIPEGKEAYISFHLPHDYVPGTDLFIHTHWSHNSANVTGGSLTWAFELSYAKGHQQQAFSAPVVATVVQNSSNTTYWHHVAETAASVSGGSGSQLDTDLIEVDGLILCRVYLDSNDLTVSAGTVNPYLHAVDIHYQSTSVGTKNKAPGFYA
jgi:hypothetical protein